MRKKIVCMLLASVLLILSVSSAYAASYSKPYNAGSVRHYFNTQVIERTSGSWSYVWDKNTYMQYFNVNTGATIDNGCQHWFYVVTGAGDPISSPIWNNQESSAYAFSLSTTSTTIKLRIYNPNYESNSTVPWRLKTIGKYTGYAY